MSIPKILFLGANGRNTTRLQLGAEVRDIRCELAATGMIDAFDLVAELAVRPNDLQNLLLMHSPHILQFSGHGMEPPGAPRAHDAPTAGASRDFTPVEPNAFEPATGGLLLEDARGSAVQLRPDVLLALLAILKRDMPLRCVVLNACFTAEQAAAIAEHVDCVAGTAREIKDDSAVAFTTAFYRAIAHGKSVGDAFALGRVEIGLRGLSGEDVPRLFCRGGITADDVFVVRKSTSIHPPKDGDKPLNEKDEHSRLQRDLERRQADLEKRLQDRHGLCALLAEKLETTNTMMTLVRALFDEPAFRVATVLADVDAVPNLAPSDRDIVRRLLWEVLPLAIDWRDVLLIAKKNLDEGRSAVELPLRTETMAEVILAGADGRACCFVDAKPYPEGAARIPMPAVMHAPFFNMEQHAVNTLVKDVVDEKIAGARSFRDYRGLPTQTEDEIEEARALVNELLADFSRKDNPQRLPHYLLFVDHLFRKDSSVDLERLWADLCQACAAKLPHLRLFRLQGGPKEFGKEIKVVLQIQKPLGKG